MRVPPAWDREPTGRWRPSGPGMGLKRVPGGRYPCRGDSVSTFDGGFAASWVYLLRHASSSSMSRSGADFPVGSRSQEVYPTPCELCESGRCGFNRLTLFRTGLLAGSRPHSSLYMAANCRKTIFASSVSVIFSSKHSGFNPSSRNASALY